MKIKRTKLTKDDMLEVTYEKDIVLNRDEDTECSKSLEHSVICKYLVHEDLKKAFEKMGPFLAHISEQLPDGVCSIGIKGVPEVQIAENAIIFEQLEVIRCNQVIFSGKDDDYGVMFAGYRKLRSGKKLNLNPSMGAIMLNEEEPTYEFYEHLSNAIGDLVFEVEKYLEGKNGETQTVIEYGGGEKTDNSEPEEPQEDHESDNNVGQPEPEPEPETASDMKVA